MRNVWMLIPALGLGLTACSSSAPAEGESDTIEVSSTADRCTVSPATAGAGSLTFQVTNDGNEVTEFYLLAEDGTKVVGEVEDIGPGLTRKLVVQADPGKYVAACKPGMSGDGIRQDFTVTG